MSSKLQITLLKYFFSQRSQTFVWAVLVTEVTTNPLQKQNKDKGQLLPLFESHA